MNKKLVLASLLGMALAASPAAMAKPDKHDKHYERDHRSDRGHERHRDQGWQREREHQWHGDRYRIDVYQAPRGYQRHHWRYGERVPAVYRSSHYVVNDYRAYRLYAPPRNHHWVRVDNDVVLTAITTGVVAAVVYGIFQ